MLYRNHEKLNRQELKPKVCLNYLYNRDEAHGQERHWKGNNFCQAFCDGSGSDP